MGKKKKQENIKITIEEPGTPKQVYECDGYILGTMHQDGPTNMLVGAHWTSLTYEEFLRILASLNHQGFSQYILPHIDNCDYCSLCHNSKEEEVSE